MRLGNYALALMMAAVIAVPADVGATTYNEYRDSLGVSEAQDTQAAKADSLAEEAAKDGKEVASGVESAVNNVKDKVAPSKKDKKKKKDQKLPKYVFIMHDNSFSYYMDAQNARWIDCPHTANKKIIDVWIRLVPDESAQDKDGTYSYPQKYYLEHYYIRPSVQQIQFLSELEVMGRPSNAIKERPYSASHWENLVPGSIEDDIYHKVVESMKEYSKNGKRGGMSTRDAVEEYLRISL